MKKFLAFTLMSSSILLNANSVKADWDYWVIKKDDETRHNLHKFYTYDSSSGTETFRTSFCEEEIQTLPNGTEVETCNVQKISFNEDTGQPVVESVKDYTYDLINDLWIDKPRNSGGSGNTTWKDSYDYIFAMPKITSASDGTIKIGSTNNTLIIRESNGEIHIGKNSLITPEDHSTLSDGSKVQHLWAEDENDNKIPINIFGSKLLIDGEEVTAGDSPQVTTNKNNISNNSSNIKNLGEGIASSTALTAALSSLPQTTKDSKLSCGFGTGAYSSKYALSFGCASKVNERVDINAGGSYVFSGAKSYGAGTLDSGIIKAGFVFKLGKLKKSLKISKREQENLKSKIISLEEKNNQLIARLVRLEKIALRDFKSKD